MPTSPEVIMSWIDALGVPGLLALVLLAIVTEVLVVGASHRRQLKDKDRLVNQLWELSNAGTQQSKRLVSVADRLSS